METLSMNKPSAEEKPVVVYFNSACPVCNAGINYQKKRLKTNPINTQEIQWNDIHKNKQCLPHTGESADITLNLMRERLHVKDSYGNTHVGINAFAVIWGASTDEKWKSRVVNLPVIHGIATIFYNIFAFVLYRWNIYRRHW